MATARPNQAGGTTIGGGGNRPRILRIGVLLGGKIVEERLIRERTSVTIGQSMKNTFSIPVDGLPLEFTLFSMEEGKYSLRFLAKMDGRLSDGSGGVHTLDVLKSGRGAQQVGDYWQVPLTDGARGKLSIGDLTVLFQFVTEPPRQPKPMLPASVRGTFADRFDPRLSVILAASILAHFAVVIIALLTDVEVPSGMAERAYNLTFKPDTYQVDVTQPEPVKTADAGSAAGSAAAEKKPEPKVANNPKPATKPDDGGGRSDRDTVAMQEEEAARFADLLTGEGEAGTSEGDMSKRRPGADLGQQISDVKEGGKTVAIGGGAGRGSRGDGDPRVGTGSGPKISGPTGPESAGGGKTEKQPTGRINVSDKQTFDESTLTPDIVLSKIQSAYMAGLKRCYKEYLKKDATARGKVTLSLTVNETGRTTSGKAKGFAGDVDDCISGLMQSWRFPIPKDKDGEATEASFAITLQLIPD
ncbi:MAG: AgmX/PglI C-terminal domain-containing protein [Deltaproteobacteria bacterium]|nr:AgmX/PglI C-terminal domain-containing protein [Deltaproteobacteria bacterium]